MCGPAAQRGQLDRLQFLEIGRGLAGQGLGDDLGTGLADLRDLLQPGQCHGRHVVVGQVVDGGSGVPEGSDLVGLGTVALEQVGDALQRGARVHAAHPFLALLGATRGGSSGCLGYSGGQGASWRPFSRSRAAMSSKGWRDCGSSTMALQGSPRRATRSGTVRMVSSSGTTESTSSQPRGVETWAPTRGRTNQAPKTVLWGAVWLKSTKNRAPRSSFHHWAVIEAGWRRSSSRANAMAPARTSKLSHSGANRTYT